MEESTSRQKILQDHELAIVNEQRLVNEITTMLESLEPLLESPGICIYKVPDLLRNSNEEAYTPQVISLGPFHRENKKLQAMEKFKVRYLKDAKERENINLKDLVTKIKAEEGSVRECYSETIALGSDDFVKMILLDAVFIIEFFWRNWSEHRSEYDSTILNNSLLRNRVELDLILLENQLPFFIIDKIYGIAFPSLSKDHPFLDFSFFQFQYFNVQRYRPRDFGSVKVLHFTDLVRKFLLPPRRRQPGRSMVIMKEMHSATQLAEVGLKFKMRSNSRMTSHSTDCSPLELKYEDGVLEIPFFELDDITEINARNLVAFEQCHYREHAYITDYYTLLSFFIKTDKDLDLLVREQVIVNWLDGIVAISMINQLSKQMISQRSKKRFYFQMNYDYYKMLQELKSFYANQSKLIITLRRVLFRTPLIGASTIIASFLLFLTLVQSVCSVLSLKYF
ncbi:hypothetical protein I3843_15G108400 [Carya illinoinensis]|nr:hypothetical protein I3843_15G108400 [Carya illinoinensis]KAG7944567.1 hypothetical protein I3843_15G108400 [Carya illinoinensis]